MKKLDYKLVNIALICLICFLLVESSELWILLFSKLSSILVPICIGFAISYFLYPFLVKLNKKIPKVLSIGILILSFLILLYILFMVLVPLLYNQFINLISYILVFIKSLSIDLSGLEKYLFEQVLPKSGKIFWDISTKSVDIVTDLIVVIVSSIYFLIDMDKIRNFLKKYLFKKSDKFYLYFKTLDIELNNYFKGLIKLIVITFFEYTIIYYILGNPNALFLGFLSALSNLIPCFGNLIVQIISSLTSFIISPRMGITVLIITFILSIFDSYILNPWVYGKSNKIHPLIIIISVFAGGILFGFIGVLISLPLSIVIVNTIKFFYDS